MTPSYRIVPAALMLALAGAAHADSPEYRLVIKNHRFEPTTLALPAGQKVKLVIENQDSTPEEFDSHSLNREKVIPGHSKAFVYIGPLEPGSYSFIGEFNSKTANGTITVK
jgi:hypothetical protein